MTTCPHCGTEYNDALFVASCPHLRISRENYIAELNRVADLSLEEIFKPGQLRLLAEMEREKMREQLAKMGFLGAKAEGPR